MAAEISRLSVNLPRKKHYKVKKAASSMGISMRELVELSLDEFLHRKPNKETEEALQESLSGKGLKKFKNAEDLFKHLKKGSRFGKIGFGYGKIDERSCFRS